MSWTNVIKTVAPWIGTALGGPLGGMAVGAIADAFDLTDKSRENVLQVLKGATPEQMALLKQADLDFQVKMQELGYKQLSDLEAIAAKDRADARAMQVTTRSNVPAVLSISVTVGYFLILIGMMLGYFKVEDSQALLIMLGSLGTAWGMVMAFWFGTTNNNGRMTDMLAKAEPVKGA